MSCMPHMAFLKFNLLSLKMHLNVHNVKSGNVSFTSIFVNFFLPLLEIVPYDFFQNVDFCASPNTCCVHTVSLIVLLFHVVLSEYLDCVFSPQSTHIKTTRTMVCI